MSLKDEIRDMRMDPPGGDWDESLYERVEETTECELCNGLGFDETISNCCGGTRDADTGLCLHCKDHSDPSPCPDCNGTGIIK